MAVPVRHVLQQGANLRALVGAGITAWQSKGRTGGSFPTPGPVLEQTIQPPSPDLVAAYVRHVGGSPGAYKGVVPPHFFPYWVFPLMSRALDGVPYDVSRVINAGVAVDVNGPLPTKGPWTVTGCLTDIDDDDKRVLFHQRLTTGPLDDPEALVARVTILIPKKQPGRRTAKADPKTVPVGARELAEWRLDGRAGLDFALLTGDFNPIHWIPLAGKAAGFGGCILHGFGTLARAWEGLNAGVYAGQVDALRHVDVRFAAPVKLPGRTALFVDDGAFYVGKAPGAPACLLGTYAREIPA
ncbi:MAG: hypothetical protein H6733_06080 [Alphaproteobacteria bacterium]|nr:hypothetical protein [Alphaproteobacteria bacterium]